MQARAITGACLAVLACLLLLQPAVAQDIATYRDTLEQAVSDLRRSPSSAPEVRLTLRNIEPIVVDDGPAITPDLTRILDDLRADPPDVEAALDRLEALLLTLDLAATEPVSNESALAALDSVLARAEFDPPAPEDSRQSLRERFFRWLGEILAPIVEPVAEWLAPLFGGGGAAGSGVVILRAILAIIGIVAIVAVVVLVIRNVRGSMTSDVAHLATQRELKLTSAEARAEAERLFQAGNFREALRSLYLATLLRLDEAGRLRFDRSLTNQEVLSTTRLHGDQMLLAQLSPLVDRFDNVWYGGAPCSADDYRAFSSLADRVWEVPA